MSETTQGTGKRTKTFGQASSMTGLLEQVQASTTIEGGLATLRTGIAGILANGLGPTITQQGYDPDAGGEDDTGGGSGAASARPVPADINIPQLSQLYQSLTIDNDEWAEALIANTPMAADTGQEGVTQSRSAFA